MKFVDFAYRLFAKAVTGFLVFLATLTIFGILYDPLTPSSVWAATAVLFLLALVFIDLTVERIQALSMIIEEVTRATITYCGQKYANLRHKGDKSKRN